MNRKATMETDYRGSPFYGVQYVRFKSLEDFQDMKYWADVMGESQNAFCLAAIRLRCEHLLEFGSKAKEKSNG